MHFARLRVPRKMGRGVFLQVSKTLLDDPFPVTVAVQLEYGFHPLRLFDGPPSRPRQSQFRSIPGLAVRVIPRWAARLDDQRASRETLRSSLELVNPDRRTTVCGSVGIEREHGMEKDEIGTTLGKV